jgi:hypothetical protein
VTHACRVGTLTRTETSVAVHRLGATRPHLAAVAVLVHRDDLWQLARSELSDIDLQQDGWDVRARWFGIVVCATPRVGPLGRAVTIEWRTAARILASPLTLS